MVRVRGTNRSSFQVLDNNVYSVHGSCSNPPPEGRSERECGVSNAACRESEERRLYLVVTTAMLARLAQSILVVVVLVGVVNSFISSMSGTRVERERRESTQCPRGGRDARLR